MFCAENVRNWVRCIVAKTYVRVPLFGHDFTNVLPFWTEYYSKLGTQSG